jgi:type III pantothenate kinase
MSVDIETPNTLGIDRVLAAYAAASLPPDAKAPRIVIDAGTAVTIDLVDQEHVFQGGVIFPGLETNLNSLHHATADLPSLADQLEKLSLDSPIGKSTESAILQGVVQAQIGAITNIAQKIADSLPDVPAPIVVASGGGIERLRPSLPDHWTYSPNLVLRGLAMVAASDRS